MALHHDGLSMTPHHIAERRAYGFLSWSRLRAEPIGVTAQEPDYEQRVDIWIFQDGLANRSVVLRTRIGAAARIDRIRYRSGVRYDSVYAGLRFRRQWRELETLFDQRIGSDRDRTAAFGQDRDTATSHRWEEAQRLGGWIEMVQPVHYGNARLTKHAPIDS